jgi:membrane-bound ClpP family serine protease
MGQTNHLPHNGSGSPGDIGGICLLLVFFVFAFPPAARAQRVKPATGTEGLFEETGEARTRLAPAGKVFVHGGI